MEGSLRQLVEDCDNMQVAIYCLDIVPISNYVQGIQIMNDTDTFGSFLSSFLASFRDEYLKLPSLVFPLMAGVVSQSPDCDDVSLIDLIPLLLLTLHTIQTASLRCFINDALYLRTLNEFSTVNVPVQPPSAWCNLLKDSLKFPVGPDICSQPETDTLPQSTSAYHQSAILSAHIETCTLPLRYDVLCVCLCWN
jgi:hypothetical protein